MSHWDSPTHMAVKMKSFKCSMCPVPLSQVRRPPHSDDQGHVGPDKINKPSHIRQDWHIYLVLLLCGQ